MNGVWETVAAVGKLLTLIAVLPALIGLVILALSIDMQTADVAMMNRAIRLFVMLIYALVPLSVGGMILWMIFEFAEEMSSVGGR